MSFISREAPTEASGFPEAEAPIIKDTAGIVKRYKATIRSKSALAKGAIILLPKIEAASTAAIRPK
jgi:hypothetical protein